MKNNLASIIGIGTLVFSFATPSVAADDAVGDFYKGKRVEFIIGTGPGGAYDLWARLIGRYLGRSIPGNPSFLPKNMPGAGGITSANYLANQAPKDGTAIGIFSRNIPTQAMLKHPAIRFKTDDFLWVGSPELTNRVCVAKKGASVKTANDLFERELLVGGVGAGTAISNTPVVLRELLGMKFKLIEGYPEPSDVLMAMKRGEVDGICQTVAGLTNSDPQWVARGDWVTLFNLERNPIPGLNAPSIFSLLKTEEQRQMIAFYSSSTELGRPIALPAGVPAARVSAVRRAFTATIDDKDFKDGAKRQGLQITALTGEELTEVVSDLMRTPPDIIQKVQGLMGQE